MALREPGHHDVVGATQFLPVRHLAATDIVEHCPGHAGAAQDSGYLDERWRMDDAGGIDPRFAACLEEQGNIKHHETTALPGGTPEKKLLIALNQRMNQRFKLAKQSGITDDTLTQALTVDAGSASLTSHYPGKCAADRLDSSSARTIQSVNTAIRIVDEGPAARQHGGDSGFSHADRTSQAEHEHRCLSPVPPSLQT